MYWLRLFRALLSPILLFIAGLSFFGNAKASPASLTYQGRILKSDGTPLEYSNVGFIFQIKGDANGKCLIYQEQVSGVDMTGSKGVFDVPLGKGSVNYPGGGFSILDAFNNSTPFTCGTCVNDGTSVNCSPAVGNTYTPVSEDVRYLSVHFWDGSGWKTISPVNIIRSVPYAAYAKNAERLGTNVASDFILKSLLPLASNCHASTFLHWNGSSFSCQSVSGASGGTVTEVQSANSYLTVDASTTVPLLTVKVGTAADTLARGDDPRIVNAVQSVNVLPPLSVTGSGTTPTVSLPSATATTNGYLSSVDWTTFNNKLSSITGSPLTMGHIWVGNASGQASVVALSGDATLSNSGVLTLNTVPIGKGGTGATSKTAAFDALSPASIKGDLIVKGAVSNTALPVGADGYSLMADSSTGTGLKWGTPVATDILGLSAITGIIQRTGANSFSAVSVATPLSYSGGTLGITVGAGSGTVAAGDDARILGAVQKSGGTMTGALTLNNQQLIFKDAATGTAALQAPPSFSANYVLKLPTNLPGLSGYVLSSDTSGNLSWIAPTTGSVTAVSVNAPLASSGGTTPTLSIAKATASVDGYLSAADFTTFNAKLSSATVFAGDISGTSSAISVDKLKTKPLVYTSITSGQFLKYDGANWINATLAISDISGLSTQLSNKVDFSSLAGNCSSAQTLTFLTPSNTWTCTTIGIAGPQITSGTIDEARLPATAINQWTTNGTSIGYTPGNVGVGTTNPNSKLEVAGLIHSSSGGIKFPDGTIQTTAATGAGGSQYDSGWFAVTTNTIYTLAHGLGAAPVNIQIFAKDNSTGKIIAVSPQFAYGYSTYGGLNSVTADGTNIKVRTWTDPYLGMYISDAGVGTDMAIATSKLRVMAWTSNTAASVWSVATNNAYYNAGNVGVGTTTPSGNLHVLNSAANNNGHLRVESSNNPSVILVNQGIQAWAQWVDTGDSNKFKIGPANSGVATAAPKLTIDASGNVGINTTTPGAKLDVNGSIIFGGGKGVLGYFNTSPYDQIELGASNASTDVSFYTNSITRVSIKPNGYMGVGTVSPSALFHVNGSALATAWNTSSDRRLKKNIAEIQNPIEKILKLRGVSFDWIKEKTITQVDHEHDIGVIAQEVEAVFPEAVSTDQQGLKSVAYSKLVAPLIESTKQLYGMCQASDKELQNQRQRLVQLENENGAIKRELAALKVQAEKNTLENQALRKDLEAIKKKLGLD